MIVSQNLKKILDVHPLNLSSIMLNAQSHGPKDNGNGISSMMCLLIKTVCCVIQNHNQTPIYTFLVSPCKLSGSKESTW